MTDTAVTIIQSAIINRGIVDLSGEQVEFSISRFEESYLLRVISWKSFLETKVFWLKPTRKEPQNTTDARADQADVWMSVDGGVIESGACIGVVSLSL